MSFVTLDWRVGPAATEIVERLHRLFTELDASKGGGSVPIRLSNSNGKFATKTEIRGGHPIVLRRDVFSKKRYQTQEKYWQRAYAITSSLIAMLADDQMLKLRFLKYKDVMPNTMMTLDEVGRILTDLALTIGVHPMAMGVLTEEKGKYHLPENVRIKATLVKNVISWHKAATEDRKDHVEMRILDHAREFRPIPQCIAQLRVTTQARHVRAVVVTEHANLSSLLVNSRFGIQDMIVVMTAGYRSSATAEFLHMLSKDPALHDVPFLFFSDHDFQGFHIFSILKYGCRSTAYLSEIQVCPQLQFAGPTLADYLQSPAAFRPEWEEQHQADNPRFSPDEITAAAEQWEARQGRRLPKKLVRADQTDRSLYKGFERTMWLQHEPIVHAELETMLHQPAKFRIADMAQVHNRYLLSFLEATVAKASPTSKPMKKRAPARRSPVGERMRQMPSQIPVAIPRQVLTEAEMQQATAATPEDLARMMYVSAASMR